MPDFALRPDFLQETPFLIVTASADVITVVVESRSPSATAINAGLTVLNEFNIFCFPLFKYA
jgi:hypothetical protein